MNLTTAVLLINDDVRTLGVRFDPMKDNGQVYTYKTLDKTIKCGDWVVVPVGNDDTFKVALVVVDDAEVDYRGNTHYRWIVSRVNTDEYKKVLELEKDAIEEVKRVERKARRESLRRSMIEHGGDAFASITFADKVEENK